MYSPFEAVEPYLLDGLDVFVGLEPLVLQGLRHGAAGAVSGLATAFPEVVSALVHEQSAVAHEHVVMLRDRLEAVPFHAAMNAVLAARGVPIRPDVRAPLRPLAPEERAAVQSILDDGIGL